MLFLVICSCLCCIHGSPTTYSHYSVDVVFLYNLSHLLDFALGGNTAEDLISSIVFFSFKALFKLIMACFVSTVGTDKKPSFTHVAHFIVEL